MHKKLGKRIAELRKKHGFTQEGFAHECGFHRAYMGAVERGEKNLTLAVMNKIATTLKISLAQLFKNV
ncbi:MAG TPA: helix-turn-helix transcriptional regulator [Candidatus Angelobacter sp.]|nr:helix-turn-helix transcriptional regulator [Candidatus Angelobacter sp.]